MREHVQTVLIAGTSRTSSVVEEEKTTSQICGDFSTSFSKASTDEMPCTSPGRVCVRSMLALAPVVNTIARNSSMLRSVLLESIVVFLREGRRGEEEAKKLGLFGGKQLNFSV